MTRLRSIASPFAVTPATGVCVRDRLTGLTREDERVLREVGEHLGRLAADDLARRIRDALSHDKDTWAERKRALTPLSSSRWAGAITKATHDQWALARRAQAAHIASLRAGIHAIEHRLSLPLGERGGKQTPGGYRSRAEWFQKTRRLAALRDRFSKVETERHAGHVSVVRGGRKLLNTRHHLGVAGLTIEEWTQQWQVARWFLTADGESGKKWGNETIRVTRAGVVSIKLPTPLAHLSNAPHGRYVLSGRVRFAHRGEEWATRVEANQAVAYRIHHHPTKGRWYLDASWQRKDTPVVPLDALRAGEVIGVDMNADHLAGWRLDPDGNPVGVPRRFDYALAGNANHRDAQVRHALTQLLHWAQNTAAKAIAVEDLDFTDSKTREQHGNKRRFRQTISGMPTSKLRARLSSMAAEVGVAAIAVDPAYTSRWGAEHWQKPTTTKTRKTTRHEAAAIAIGRRALGHRIRRRMTPPPHDQSDRVGHRTVQANPVPVGVRKPAISGNGPQTRSVGPPGARNAGNQAAQHRSVPPTDRNSVSLSA